nr:RNA-binding protein [Propionibacterium sp.]
MGLTFPDDLAAWQRWQQDRHRVRALKSRLSPTPANPASFVLASRGEEPARLLVVLESTSASSLASLVEPLRHLLDVPVAVVAPTNVTAHLPGEGWSTQSTPSLDLAHDLAEVALVLAAGHYLPLGALVHRQASARGLTFAVVQHGLMTSLAPPLPPDARLLAWSQADADFWRSGRGDVESVVVGSQLLHQAAAAGADHVSRFARPTWLGQLHGAELPRLGMMRAATDFCLREHATYRPHPSERDGLSLLTHAAWERMGIELDRSGVPLFQTNAPVVSAFSTGVLEAAARGVPAWVSYPHPPAWLGEFWERYGLKPWGGEPTPAPALRDIEPARALADWIVEELT